MADLESAKQKACKAIDRAATDLNSLSQEIWNKPELGYEENSAHQVLTDFLEKNGFNVERKFAVDTAFRATFGSQENSGINACVICEYDALPEIGHACGHNPIAEAGAGAGLGIKAAMEAAGRPLGKLTVMGTPAEEGGAGKFKLIDAGAFQDIDLAMMVHPANLACMASPSFLAYTLFDVTFQGKASHAAYAPWEGVNALDAAVMFYQGMSVMRQQVKSTWRIHGIISNGGAKPNIIPEKTVVNYQLRTPTEVELSELKERALACAEGAAKSTGCTMEYTYHSGYSNVVHNKPLIKLFVNNAEGLGVKFMPESEVAKRSNGSTDMGNVTYEVPGIHPMFCLETDAVIHSRGFTKAAGAPEAQEPTLVQAKAMAMTVLDVFFHGEDAMKQIREDFEEDMKKNKGK
ncbi:peptidase M20 domain-containing protein 2-like [Ptychodera flava]|uniref:peptidase M20 domain-containing protein 2-like n=1 Tax=Ptychodera flava TaxID=63121 RepID=UPI00396A9247